MQSLVLFIDTHTRTGTGECCYQLLSRFADNCSRLEWTGRLYLRYTELCTSTVA